MKMKKMSNFNTVKILAMLGVASTPLVHAGAGPKVTAVSAKTPAPAPSDVSANENPNILIIMLDDAGFAHSETFGGEIHTPTMTRIANAGISYNAFHTTAVSSATRASLLTGRNHHRVGNGSVAEIAIESNAGYTGIIPTSAATISQMLKLKGYTSAAFGKWHNTPVRETGPRGPFTHWPTSYGFDHFYGFMGGESDQYRPRLFNDTKAIEPPRDPRYHLTEDLTKQTINWIQQQHAAAPKKPFFVYWAPGGVHSPHQVFPEWADKYKGKFDSGWDAYRQRTFERQKASGWIPKDTVNAPRPEDLQAWKDVPDSEKPFQSRLMEVYAGFLEHTDTQAGKIVDELDRLGLRKNTLIFYIFSDNGASAEGVHGSINDTLGFNGIASTPRDSIKALNERYGGLQALGGPKLAPHYAASWAWAGETPFVGTKLVAGYFGGTRVPMAISWPAKIVADKAVRNQFHHVNDIASTIYDVVKLKPQETLNGVKQLPLDGVSMAYTFANASAADQKGPQYFEFAGSRAQYSNGWIASVFGPRKPWSDDIAGLLSWSGKAAFITRSPWIGNTLGWMKWKPENDQWSLYNLKTDYSQTKDLAQQYPQKLAELKAQFERDAEQNHVNPVGETFVGIFNQHVETRKEWHFDGNFDREPEFAAPNIKSRDNTVTVDADFPAQANGVLFSLGSTSGGIALFVKDGFLNYEYNGFSLYRTVLKSSKKIPVGRAKVSVELSLTSRKRAGPAEIILRVNDEVVARGSVPHTAAFSFTGSATFDIGKGLGSPVSLDYYDQGTFAFNGKIHDVMVRYN